MPHFILASAGTHGDVLPYAALSRELAKQGHRVTLAVNEGYADLAEKLGVEFAPLVSNDETLRLIGNPDIWHPVKSAIVGSRWGVSLLEEQFELLSRLSEPENTVIAASPAILAARMIQEKHARPLATIYHLPWMVRSCSLPPAMMAGFSLPAWAPRPFGRLYWWGVDMAARVLVGRKLNQFRSKVGLPKVTRPFSWWVSPDLAIGLFADWYAEPQQDWIPQLKVSGFPIFDGFEQPQDDAAVAEFCEAGPPPVVFTFGTGMIHAHRLFAAATEACVQSKRRGILLARDADQIPGDLPDDVRHIEYVSLEALLPRCSAIVHHGGLGTTARGLAAGTPQLIIPHAWDQLDNAQRVMRLGTGAMLKRGRCTAARLAEALAVLDCPQTSQRCREISEKFHDNPGLNPAVRWLEEFAAAKLSL